MDLIFKSSFVAHELDYIGQRWPEVEINKGSLLLEAKRPFRNRSPLFTGPILLGFGLWPMTHFDEQMKVDKLRVMVQHSVSQYVAMQIFIKSTSVLF